MNRRSFLMGMGAGILTAPLVAAAQEGRKVIGYLSLGLSPPPRTKIPLIQALSEIGWVEGESFRIEARWAEGRPERLPALAADLVRAKVDVIVAVGWAGVTAKRATATIPIVVTHISDPVRVGLVKSHGQPGGNATAVTNLAYDLTPKQLELVKEFVPRTSRVAILGLRSGYEVLSGRMSSAAKALGVTLYYGEVRNAADYDATFAAITSERADALLVQPDPVNGTQIRRICAFASTNRLAAIGSTRVYTDAGCLMSYGASSLDIWRRAAVQVDKILRGTSPASIPVEEPTKFELVINLKTAKALGLTIPPSLLLRADQVIE